MRERLMVWAFEHPNAALVTYLTVCGVLAVAATAGVLQLDRWWQRRTSARDVVDEAEAIVAEAAARIARTGGL